MTEDAGREPDASTASADTFVGDLFAWLDRVKADHDLPGPAFVIAYAIGQHMDRRTRTAFPGLLCLAEEVGRDEKNVRNAIRALTERGHLIVAKRRGGGGSTQYLMPAVERAKSPGQNSRHNRSERAKSPGQNAPAEGAERAKTPALRTDAAGSERAFSPGQSGRNRPPNQPIEPASESAAPQPPRDGGGMADGYARQAGRQPFLDPTEVASCPPPDGVSDREDFAESPEIAVERQTRHRREAEWRALLVTEGVVTQPDASPLHDLIAGGYVTEADVLQGIREGLAKPDFRPEQWRSLVGWARRAASRRLSDTPRPDASAPAARPPDAIEVPGGAVRTRRQFEEARARWDEGYAWDQSFLGFPPDSEHTSAPADLRGPRRRRAAVDRPAETVQADAERSTSMLEVQP